VERERRLKQDREITLAAEQAAVKAKNLFLGMVSHELRSPLQGIVSGLDLLEAEAGASRLIQGIRRDAEALNAQLADLLTLAKGEAGRLEVHPQAFEACDLVTDLADRFAEQARAKGLHFAATVPDEPVFVVADHARIGQCLTNLISNAIKYTGQGRVEVRLFPYDETVRSLRFEVCDTGPGLPAGFNVQDTEPFRRLAPEDSQGQAGAGIGLVIVRLIVSHLGGSLTLSTPPGGGTAFRIDIPAEPSGTGEPQPTPGDVVQMLVVDDRPEVLEGLCAVARHSGYQCEQAPNAAVAANMLAAKRYDVVLVDLDMPIKRGEDLALETRRGGGCNSRTPLIAISASGEPVPGGARMGPFNAYLPKPIGQQGLTDTVGRVMRHARSVA
jgi:CheY-like chemotaxis protein/two-component sensor histidine kinase